MSTAVLKIAERNFLDVLKEFSSHQGRQHAIAGESTPCELCDTASDSDKNPDLDKVPTANDPPTRKVLNRIAEMFASSQGKVEDNVTASVFVRSEDGSPKVYLTKNRGCNETEELMASRLETFLRSSASSASSESADFSQDYWSQLKDYSEARIQKLVRRVQEHGTVENCRLLSPDYDTQERVLQLGTCVPKIAKRTRFNFATRYCNSHTYCAIKLISSLEIHPQEPFPSHCSSRTVQSRIRSVSSSCKSRPIVQVNHHCLCRVPGL
ncbi:hypothetical protein CC86DRAFT_400933 [Ophiobolus disseminans]|uniref:Uncharacterized protein n=1 Tax=Ophiobolus disseminans TaxID=1469910 RepID=A0A6A7AFS4_9PLEO|nr:hypothetical protein CC86DRAFT_400933 [Ophiobolus disseminans]